MRLNGGSRINREVYVRFYERLRGQFPWSTHQGGMEPRGP